MPPLPISAHRSKVSARKISPTATVSFALGASRKASILPGIPGVDFDAAWEKRVEVVIDTATGLKANFISADDLIASKLASGRTAILPTLRTSAKRWRANGHRQKKPPEPSGPNRT